MELINQNLDTINNKLVNCHWIILIIRISTNIHLY